MNTQGDLLKTILNSYFSKMASSRDIFTSSTLISFCMVQYPKRNLRGMSSNITVLIITSHLISRSCWLFVLAVVLVVFGSAFLPLAVLASVEMVSITMMEQRVTWQLISQCSRATASVEGERGGADSSAE